MAGHRPRPRVSFFKRSLIRFVPVTSLALPVTLSTFSFVSSFCCDSKGLVYLIRQNGSEASCNRASSDWCALSDSTHITIAKMNRRNMSAKMTGNATFGSKSLYLQRQWSKSDLGFLTSHLGLPWSGSTEMLTG